MKLAILMTIVSLALNLMACATSQPHLGMHERVDISWVASNVCGVPSNWNTHRVISLDEYKRLGGAYPGRTDDVVFIEVRFEDKPVALVHFDPKGYYPGGCTKL